MPERLTGPLLVLLAALLWGTDSVFRFPTAEVLDPTFIVFLEHIAGWILLTPFVWKRHSGDAFKLGWKGWMHSLIIGAGGGAIATVLFTASFRYLNPSVTILLQKFQPITTVMLAYWFLGERPERKFYFWAPIALIAGFILSFPDFDVSFLQEGGNLRAKGIFYALGAATLWSIATVAGRALLHRTSPLLTTFWRYTFGLLTLTAILYLARIQVDPSVVFSKNILIALAYLSVVTGIIPMLTYYAGLARSSATVTTFVELAYPISAVALNAYFLHTGLSPVQMAAGGVLLFAVTMISL